MRKTRTAFLILSTLFTLTITSQPAMSYNAGNSLNGTVIRVGYSQATGLTTEAALLRASVYALIGSQLGYYPVRHAPPPRARFYSRPSRMAPGPFFTPRPVIYAPHPRHYRNHQKHRKHRKHQKRHGRRVRW